MKVLCRVRSSRCACKQVPLVILQEYIEHSNICCSFLRSQSFLVLTFSSCQMVRYQHLVAALCVISRTAKSEQKYILFNFCHLNVSYRNRNQSFKCGQYYVPVNK